MHQTQKVPRPQGGDQERRRLRGRTPRDRFVAEIALLLGARPRRRDLLIEHLHLIQDAYGQISAAHLTALAEEMRISLAEAYETATFYAHFDVVKEEERSVPPVTIRVCDGIACQLAGAEAMLTELMRVRLDGARILRAPCIGQCACAPAAVVGQNVIAPATTQALSAAAKARELVAKGRCDVDHGTYRNKGGYALYERLLADPPAAEQALGEIDRAGLRGMGGAGFPAARKWRAVRGMSGRKAVIVNADEGEPGTFKDRHILERDPHRVLEGALIASVIAGADEVYFYLRDEYAGLRATLSREIATLPPTWPVIHLRRGAGSYVCGEESALIESLEGKRGYPRQRPPLPVEAGLFGRPTVANNVETLFFVRDILERGAAWWRSQGRNGGIGLRHYSVSGRVAEPGVKLAPAGVTLRELVDKFCGGMADGHRLAAYLPGGASGGILPPSLESLPLDFGALEPHGCFIGSAAVVVLSQADDLRSVARNLTHFFADESCGQCTPCRLGTAKAAQLMSSEHWDLDLLAELSAVMRDASICGLGQAAPNPVMSLMRHFPHVFEEARS